MFVLVICENCYFAVAIVVAVAVAVVVAAVVFEESSSFGSLRQLPFCSK